MLLVLGFINGNEQPWLLMFFIAMVFSWFTRSPFSFVSLVELLLLLMSVGGLGFLSEPLGYVLASSGGGFSSRWRLRWSCGVNVCDGGVDVDVCR